MWRCPNYERTMDPRGLQESIDFKITSVSGKEVLDVMTQRHLLIEFMKLLSVAHMCDVEVIKGDELFYNGPSPDEVALVDFAATQNFKCTYSGDDLMKIKSNFKNGKQTEFKFKVYRKMEFNSDRKRMSILFSDPNDGKIKLYMKGADSIILSRVDPKQFAPDMEDKIDWFVTQSSKQGLRTLLMAMKVVDEDELR